MNKMLIRKGEKKDAAQISEIEKMCFSGFSSEETVLKEMENNKWATYIVAQINEGIIGYVGFWSVIDSCDINNIAVLPDYRGLGVGTLLMEEVIRLAGVSRVEKIMLEVRSSNAAAMELYKKAGFKEVAVRKAYYEDNGEDAIIMSRYGVEK